MAKSDEKLIKIGILGTLAFVAKGWYDMALAGNGGDDALDMARRIHNIFHPDDPLPTRANPNPKRKAPTAPGQASVPSASGGGQAPATSPATQPAPRQTGADPYGMVAGYQYVAPYGNGYVVVVRGRQIGGIFTSLSDAQNAYNQAVDGTYSGSSM